MPESSRRRQRAEKRTGSVSGTHRPDRVGNNPRRRQRNCRGSGQGRNPAPHKTGTLGTLPQSPTTAPPQSPTTVPPAARHCSLPVLLLCGLLFPVSVPRPCSASGKPCSAILSSRPGSSSRIPPHLIPRSPFRIQTAPHSRFPVPLPAAHLSRQQSVIFCDRPPCPPPKFPLYICPAFCYPS